ncbi:MAG: amidohydrolase, partial [Dermabacteraceae bacterium]
MTSEQSAPRAQHTEVSTAYLRQLDQEREAAMRAASHPGSAFDGAPPALHDLLEARVALGADEMVALMLDLAAHPEVAFEEHRSARAIADHLAAHGIEAQLGVHGLATAVRAEIRGAGADEEGAP